MEEIKRCLSNLNSIFKECDEIYRVTAKKMGIPDCAFWILYILRTDGSTLTQREICSALYEPKQTVNTALKKLVEDGYIELLADNDRRSRQLRLTEKGIGFAERTVDQVILRELSALSALSAEERALFFRLFRKYIGLLDENMRVLGDTRGNIAEGGGRP